MLYPLQPLVCVYINILLYTVLTLCIYFTHLCHMWNAAHNQLTGCSPIQTLTRLQINVLNWFWLKPPWKHYFSLSNVFPCPCPHTPATQFNIVISITIHFTSFKFQFKNKKKSPHSHTMRKWHENNWEWQNKRATL